MRSFGSSVNQKYLITVDDDEAKEKMLAYLKSIYAKYDIKYDPEKIPTENDLFEEYTPQEFMKALRKDQRRKKSKI